MFQNNAAWANGRTINDRVVHAKAPASSTRASNSRSIPATCGSYCIPSQTLRRLESSRGVAREALISCPKQSDVTAEHVKATMTQVNNAMNASFSVIRAHALLDVTCLQGRAVTPRFALYERANVLSKRAGDERTGHPIGDRGWPPDRGSPDCARAARPGSRRAVPRCQRGSAGARQAGQSDSDGAVRRDAHGGRATPSRPVHRDARGRAVRAPWAGRLPAHVTRPPGRRSAIPGAPRRHRRGPDPDRPRHRTRYGQRGHPPLRPNLRE
jgi:hypothetical protein